MEGEFLTLKSSKADPFYWDKIPYTKGANGIFLPESKVYSLHTGWANMHFHLFDRIKYALFFNFYDVFDARRTDAQSDQPTFELNLMVTNQIYNKLGSLNAVRIPQGHFNLTYAPFIDSIAQFEKNQFYCTMDIHIKEAFFNELLNDYPSVMEPLLNAMIHHQFKRTFENYGPCTLFMEGFWKSIIRSINKGPAYLPLIDKDVEALIVHAVNYQTTADLGALDKGRASLLNEIYNKIISDLHNFPGLKELTDMANTNSTTLNRMFKEAFSVTLKQCWIKYRLDTALYMLVHQRDKLISEIAAEIGFSCMENFSKAFKAEYQHSPSFCRMNEGDIDLIFQEFL